MNNEKILFNWSTSELLKEAAIHLRDKPEYVPMKAEARMEMAIFCRQLRRELMGVQECSSDVQLSALQSLRDKLNMTIDTDDFCRYVATVHGYGFTFIMDIPDHG